MNILLVGSGGREHALAWKIKASPLVRSLVMAPGNPGMASLGDLKAISPTDVPALVVLAQDMGADLVVIGPEVSVAQEDGTHLHIMPQQASRIANRTFSSASFCRGWVSTRKRGATSWVGLGGAPRVRRNCPESADGGMPKWERRTPEARASIRPYMVHSPSAAILRFLASTKAMELLRKRR